MGEGRGDLLLTPMSFQRGVSCEGGRERERRKGEGGRQLRRNLG